MQITQLLTSAGRKERLIDGEKKGNSQSWFYIFLDSVLCIFTLLSGSVSSTVISSY